jgi:putative ABC transport system substrate-binding protein
MRRRQFVTLLGGAAGAAAWPVVARAQQPAMPVIGYLSSLSEAQVAAQLAAFRRGLAETGFEESRNIALQFRWAEGQYQRLPAMATEFAGLPVTLILAQAPPAALAAKAASATIPIVFVVGFDPVAGGCDRHDAAEPFSRPKAAGNTARPRPQCFPRCAAGQPDQSRFGP